MEWNMKSPSLINVSRGRSLGSEQNGIKENSIVFFSCASTLFSFYKESLPLTDAMRSCLFRSMDNLL